MKTSFSNRNQHRCHQDVVLTMSKMFRSVFDTSVVTLLLFTCTWFNAVSSSNVTEGCDINSSVEKKIFCYFNVEDNSFKAEFINPCLCTHLVYDYWGILPNLTLSSGPEEELKALTLLKQTNPQVKVLVSLRGVQTEDDKNTTSQEESIVEPKTLVRFAESVRKFVDNFNVDGVVIDVQYRRRNRLDKMEPHKEGVTLLLKAIREALDKKIASSDKIIGITVSRHPFSLINGYNFGHLSSYVDFFNLPAFDLVSSTGGSDFEHPARLHGVGDMENMDSLVDLMLSLGVQREKLIAGIPAHGVSYKMIDSTELSRPSANAWTVPYSELCKLSRAPWWKVQREKDQTAPFVADRNIKVGFDDEISVRLKAKYILLRKLGGATLWWINEDDFQDNCGRGHYPLLRNVWDVFSDNVKNDTKIELGLDDLEEYLEGAESQFVDVVDKVGLIDRIDGYNVKVCSRQGYYRHSEDCSRFYRCVKFSQYSEEYTIFEYDCPAGLVFDERYEVCNWPSWSPPCQGSGEIFPVPRDTFICPGPGYFHDPENCRWFYYCMDFWGNGTLQAFEFKCPFNLVFDEDKLLCNWPWLVPGCYDIYGLFGTRIRGYDVNIPRANYQKIGIDPEYKLGGLYANEKTPYVGYDDQIHARIGLDGTNKEYIGPSVFHGNRYQTGFRQLRPYLNGLLSGQNEKYYLGRGLGGLSTGPVAEQKYPITVPQVGSDIPTLYNEQGRPRFNQHILQDGKQFISHAGQADLGFIDRGEQRYGGEVIKDRPENIDKVTSVNPVLVSEVGQNTPDHDDQVNQGVPVYVSQTELGSPEFIEQVKQETPEFVSDIRRGNIEFSDQVNKGFPIFVNQDEQGTPDFRSIVAQGEPGFVSEGKQNVPENVDLVIQGSPESVKQGENGTPEFVDQGRQETPEFVDQGKQGLPEFVSQHQLINYGNSGKYIPETFSPARRGLGFHYVPIARDPYFESTPKRSWLKELSVRALFETDEPYIKDQYHTRQQNEQLDDHQGKLFSLVPTIGKRFVSYFIKGDDVFRKGNVAKHISPVRPISPYKQTPLNPLVIIHSPQTNKEVFPYRNQYVLPETLYNGVKNPEYSYVPLRQLPVYPGRLNLRTQYITGQERRIWPEQKAVTPNERQINVPYFPDIRSDGLQQGFQTANKNYNFPLPKWETSAQEYNLKSPLKTSAVPIAHYNYNLLPPNENILIQRVPKQPLETLNILPPRGEILVQQEVPEQPLKTLDKPVTDENDNKPPSTAEYYHISPPIGDILNQQEYSDEPINIPYELKDGVNCDSLPPDGDILKQEVPLPLHKSLNLPITNEYYNLPPTYKHVLVKPAPESQPKTLDVVTTSKEYDLPPSLGETFVLKSIPEQPVKHFDIQIDGEIYNTRKHSGESLLEENIPEQPPKSLGLPEPNEVYNSPPFREELLEQQKVPEQPLKTLDAPFTSNNFDAPPFNEDISSQPKVFEELPRIQYKPIEENCDNSPHTEVILVHEIPDQLPKTLDVPTDVENYDLPPSIQEVPIQQQISEEPENVPSIPKTVGDYEQLPPNGNILLQQNIPEQPVNPVDVSISDIHLEPPPPNDVPTGVENCDLPSSIPEVPIEQQISEEPENVPSIPKTVDDYEQLPPNGDILLQQNVPEQPVNPIDASISDVNFEAPPPNDVPTDVENCDLPASTPEVPIQQQISEEPENVPSIPKTVGDYEQLPPNGEILLQQNIPEQPVSPVDVSISDINFEAPPPNDVPTDVENCDLPPSIPEVPIQQQILKESENVPSIPKTVGYYEQLPPHGEILLQQNIPEQPVSPVDVSISDINFEAPPPNDVPTGVENCDLPPSIPEVPIQQQISKEPENVPSIPKTVGDYEQLPPNGEILLQQNIPEQPVSPVDVSISDINFESPSPNDVPTDVENCDLPPSIPEVPIQQQISEEPENIPSIPKTVDDYEQLPPNGDILLQQNVPEQPVNPIDVSLSDINFEAPPPNDVPTDVDNCDLPPSIPEVPIQQQISGEPENVPNIPTTAGDYEQLPPNGEILLQQNIPEQPLNPVDVSIFDINFEPSPPIEGTLEEQEVPNQNKQLNTNFVPPPTEEIIAPKEVSPQLLNIQNDPIAGELNYEQPPNEEILIEQEQPQVTPEIISAHDDCIQTPSDGEIFVHQDVPIISGPVTGDSEEAINGPTLQSQSLLPSLEGLKKENIEKPLGNPIIAPPDGEYYVPPGSEEIITQQEVSVSPDELGKEVNGQKLSQPIVLLSNGNFDSVPPSAYKNIQEDTYIPQEGLKYGYSDQTNEPPSVLPLGGGPELLSPNGEAIIQEPDIVGVVPENVSDKQSLADAALRPSDGGFAQPPLTVETPVQEVFPIVSENLDEDIIEEKPFIVKDSPPSRDGVLLQHVEPFSETPLKPDLPYIDNAKDIPREDTLKINQEIPEEVGNLNRFQSPLAGKLAVKGRNNIPVTACTRPGLFRHPDDCGKFYECYWDKTINKFTLHIFSCPVKLVFDEQILGCGSSLSGLPCVTKK
ncbi:uncharacterized protein LOC143238393 [Tachypleus tridentatus]|uniref:uncharacterized protein LOC143238393 n=1 Tax=Tachypleus tridentatus TaxID=6853 RepID=UPI003FD57EE8